MFYSLGFSSGDKAVLWMQSFIYAHAGEGKFSLSFQLSCIFHIYDITGFERRLTFITAMLETNVVHMHDDSYNMNNVTV